MKTAEIGALLAYADRLAPRYAPADENAARERFTQWADLMRDVPPTAPHPNGRSWDASQAVRHHVATSPYPIQPADIARLWHTFKRDVLGRHTYPADSAPYDPAAYRAELLGGRHAVAIGAATATTYRELTGGPAPAVAARLAALGEYMPRAVADELAAYRPRRAQREQFAAADQPDALDVPCGWCRARTGQPCRSPGTRRDRNRPHPSRLDAATAHHQTRQESA